MKNNANGISARERIEQAAIELFARKGYADTSVREIVEAARVTKPVLYYYFGSKEHLYDALAFERFDEFFAWLRERTLAGKTLRERLVGYANAHFERIRSHPTLARFILGTIFSSGSGAPHVNLNERLNQFDQLVLEVLSEGAERGEFPAANLTNIAVVQFIGCVSVYVLSNAIGMEENPGPEQAEGLVDLFLNGLEKKNA